MEGGEGKGRERGDRNGNERRERKRWGGEGKERLRSQGKLFVCPDFV